MVIDPLLGKISVVMELVNICTVVVLNTSEIVRSSVAKVLLSVDATCAAGDMAGEGVVDVDEKVNSGGF